MEQQILKVIEILFGIGVTAVTPFLVQAQTIPSRDID